jgi:arsenite methyltransferase
MPPPAVERVAAAASQTAIMADDYSQQPGYHAAADLGLGCGLPTEFAKIKAGDTVIDLGSGAGNDCFIARSVTGDTGKIIGIDFTERMIERATVNARQLQYNNVEFRLGDIEHMPGGRQDRRRSDQQLCAKPRSQ